MTPERASLSDRWTSADVIDRTGDALSLVIALAGLLMLGATAPLWLTSAVFRRWLMRALDWVLA